MKHSCRSPKVFVPNDGFHDYSKAERFGELVYITRGQVNRFEANDIARQCAKALQDARAGDYILISSLPVISAVASAMFSARFGRLNLLIYGNRENDYYSRSIMIREETHDRNSGDSELLTAGSSKDTPPWE